MAPIVHIVRHAQGYHSVAKDGHLIQDPELTPRGVDQARELGDSFTHQENVSVRLKAPRERDRADGWPRKVQLLVASPMRRTIETCLIAFTPCIERGLKVVAMPLAQEATNEISDTGSSREKIAELFGDKVDISHVEPGWNHKEGQYAVEPGTVMERSRKLRRWLKAQDAEEIVLVNHGKIAHFLTGDVNEKGEQTTG